METIERASPLTPSELSQRLTEIVSALLQDHTTKARALQSLASLVDVSEGNRAAAVGEALRDFGAIEPLLMLIDHDDVS